MGRFVYRCMFVPVIVGAGILVVSNMTQLEDQTIATGYQFVVGGFALAITALATRLSLKSQGKARW